MGGEARVVGEADAGAEAEGPDEAVGGDGGHAVGEEGDDAVGAGPVVVLVEAFVEFADGQDGGFVGGLRGVEAGDAGGGEAEGGGVRGGMGGGSSVAGWSAHNRFQRTYLR